LFEWGSGLVKNRLPVSGLAAEKRTQILLQVSLFYHIALCLRESISPFCSPCPPGRQGGGL
jgi:hypothetical protein